MKYILMFGLAVVLSGCGTTQIKTYHQGYRSYDPCIKCGEKFQRIPNFENEASIRWNRGERW